MSNSNFNNYTYQLCPTDEMDNIEKRSGKCKFFTSCLFFFASILYVFLYGRMNNVEPVDNAANLNHTANTDSPESSKKNYYIVIYGLTVFSLWAVVIVSACIMHRICLLVEEWKHLKSRYEKSYQKLLTAVFSGGWNYVYIFGTAVLGYCCYMDDKLVMNLAKSNANILIVTATTLNVYLNWKVWTDTEFQHSKSHIPSTGTFMAYAAYYSYYKNVLPKLKERITKAEKEHNIKIPFKKLIVLFPTSGRISSSLENGTDEIERVDHLSPIETDKDGTFNRKMTNPIYKIAPKNKEPYYCIVEGQNSLPVLKSMQQSKEIFRQQSYLLYKTLKEILDDSGEKDTYYLFSYNDEDEDNPQTLSQLLWNELDKQLKK